MRTQEEINRQITGLEQLKTTLPAYSAFGGANHEKIDAQISILKGNEELSDFPEGDWDEMDEENDIFRAAEEAEQWLDGDNDEDLFE